jgi:sulfur carrier protein
VRVYLNGESKDLSDAFTLADLVAELNLPAVRIAVELNRNVVRRRDWQQTVLSENDRIEIVHFVGGGCTSGSLGAHASRVQMSAVRHETIVQYNLQEYHRSRFRSFAREDACGPSEPLLDLKVFKTGVQSNEFLIRGNLSYVVRH